jgi:hypothetical protein
VEYSRLLGHYTVLLDEQLLTFQSASIFRDNHSLTSEEEGTTIIEM